MGCCAALTTVAVLAFRGLLATGSSRAPCRTLSRLLRCRVYCDVARGEALAEFLRIVISWSEGRACDPVSRSRRPSIEVRSKARKCRRLVPSQWGGNPSCLPMSYQATGIFVWKPGCSSWQPRHEHAGAEWFLLLVPRAVCASREGRIK